MSISVTLTTIATLAVQFTGQIDSGEGLSTQQLTDATTAANFVLDSWWQEQALAIQILINKQSRDMALLVDKLARLGTALAASYTVAGGSYTAATYTAPSYNAGSVPQFANATTPINLPDGIPLALSWALAVGELGAQYSAQVTPAMLRSAAQARAACNPVPNRIPIPGTAGQATVPPAPPEASVSPAQ